MAYACGGRLINFLNVHCLHLVVVGQLIVKSTLWRCIIEVPIEGRLPCFLSASCGPAEGTNETLTAPETSE